MSLQSVSLRKPHSDLHAIYIALVIYEYLVTFTTEVQLFWVRELTGASILFFINRYLMLLYILAELWGYSPLTGTVSVSTSMLGLLNKSYKPHRRTSSMR